MLNRDQVVAILRKAQGKKTQREFAEEMKISPAYLSDIYAGKRSPGPTILRALKLKSYVGYAK